MRPIGSRKFPQNYKECYTPVKKNFQASIYSPFYRVLPPGHLILRLYEFENLFYSTCFTNNIVDSPCVPNIISPRQLVASRRTKRSSTSVARNLPRAHSKTVPTTNLFHLGLVDRGRDCLPGLKNSPKVQAQQVRHLISHSSSTFN